jgi:hypothetical protein
MRGHEAGHRTMLQWYEFGSVRFTGSNHILPEVLNAQEKRSIGIKFLRASSWNKELSSYAARFTTRQADLNSALSMRTAITVEEINAKSVLHHQKLFAH